MTPSRNGIRPRTAVDKLPEREKVDMNIFKKWFPVLALLAVMCGQAVAATTFTKSLGAGLAVIPASEHGFSSSKLGVKVFNSSGQRQLPGSYSYTINATTYEFTISMGFSGSVSLTGPFDSQTTGTYDFAFGYTAESPTAEHTKKLRVGAASPFSYRIDGSHGFVFSGGSEFSFTSHGVGNYWAWLDKSSGKVVWGYSGSSLPNAACTSRCDIQFNVSDYPSSGIVQLGRTSRSLYYGQYWFGTFYDDRPYSWTY